MKQCPNCYGEFSDKSLATCPLCGYIFDINRVYEGEDSLITEEKSRKVNLVVYINVFVRCFLAGSLLLLLYAYILSFIDRYNMTGDKGLKYLLFENEALGGFIFFLVIFIYVVITIPPKNHGLLKRTFKKLLNLE